MQGFSETHSLELTVLVTPDMANFSGRMHGGELLRWLDKAAYACALRYSGHYAVTLSVDKVLFKQPIHIGEMITLMARVNYTGRTSMEIGIKVVAEDFQARSVRHTNTCYFTMVAVDDKGKPVSIPKLTPADDEAEQRWKAAERRRELRKQ